MFFPLALDMNVDYIETVSNDQAADQAYSS
jgi:hypothetical protein